MDALIALAGRPNTGKTTLFNALTGLRQRVANFAGCTVEKAVGTMLRGGAELEIVDLPGTFSILPSSSDERVALDFLRESARSGRALRVLCVAEASNLSNDVALALALKEQGYAAGLVVNMIDEAELNGIAVDGPRLETELGMPVRLVAARERRGLDGIGEWINLINGDGLTTDTTKEDSDHELQRRASRQAQEIVNRCVRLPRGAVLPTIQRSIAIDRWLFHPMIGPIILFGTMFGVFQSLFVLAAPLQDGLENVLGALALTLRPAIPSPLLGSLVCDGAIAGVAAVAVFVPQIAILFLLIGLLEASGYLPRAGAMVDRALRPFGLDGKVFLPFLSSFACAIPGVMATRTIPSERRRLVAVLLCPLMTCSARIPVYALMIAAFVPADARILGLGAQAVVMAGLYLLGACTALALAFGVRHSRLYEPPSMAATVLPPYRLPRAGELARFVWTRCGHFLSRAGKVIFVLSLALWILGRFPAPPTDAPPSARLEHSLLGRAGKAVEPLFAPLGFDWRLSVATLSSLAAREVFVGTMGTLFALEGEGLERGLSAELARRYTLPTAVAVLLFFAIALQCVSTVAIVRRETGGWSWPAVQFSVFFVLAYALAYAGYRLTAWLI